MASITNNLGRFDIYGELIREALALPSNATIVRILAHPTKQGVFSFVIDWDDFPETEPGEIVPLYSPIITADYDKKPSTWLTIDFGKPVKE